MNAQATLIADNLDREDGLPTKAVATFPAGRLTAVGFTQALRRKAATKVLTTVTEDGDTIQLVFARKYIKEALNLLNDVYPSVRIELTFDGKFHKCHENCQQALGEICECKCLYLFHGGEGLPGIIVNWKTHPTKGYMIGREQGRTIEHEYTNEGLPEGGNTLYYLARLFEGEDELAYMRWYKSEVERKEQERLEVLRISTAVRVRQQLWRDAKETGTKYEIFRYRVAKLIADRGYGTLRKSTFGRKGNAEELIIDYVAEQHNGDIESALQALSEKRTA